MRKESGEPEEIQAEPWLSDDAIQYLDSIVKPEFRVLEHGGGGSTLWLAQRVEEVVTVENNPEWSAAIERKAKELGLRNIWLLKQWPVTPEAWGKFDLVCVDGAPMTERSRALADAFVYYVKPNGWVMLDDFQSPIVQMEVKWANEIARFATMFELDKTGTIFWSVGAEPIPALGLPIERKAEPNYKAKLGMVARQLYHEYHCKTCLNHGCRACGECNIEVVLNDPVVKAAAYEQKYRDATWVQRMAERGANK